MPLLQRSSLPLVCALVLWLSSAGPTVSAATPPRPAVMASVVAVTADGWSWQEFVKYWRRQAGKTSGVIGIVLLVALGAVLLILSKTRN